MSLLVWAKQPELHWLKMRRSTKYRLPDQSKLEKKILEAAAGNLKHVALELGGKVAPRRICRHRLGVEALNPESEIGPLMSAVQLNSAESYVNNGAQAGQRSS
jgi:acyl-CoA reductase-like NAD-dependent aldehyde dehydrogenase